jgi:hypothetical protein
MTEETTFKIEENYVKVESRVEKTSEWAAGFWPELVKFCEANNCYRVLSLSYSMTTMPFFDAFDTIDRFRDLGIDRKYRIAWVELNAEAHELVNFIDEALYNRGLPGRVFDSESDAKKWLLEDDGF